MNKNVILILCGAVLTALIVAFGVQAVLSPKKAEDTAALNMTRILVAAERLNEGETLDVSKLKWQEWPETALIRGVYRQKSDQKIEDLKIMGKTVRRSLEAEEPVLSSIVLKQDKGNFLAASLDPGMLAYSIPVSPAASVGGFARPGDFVDVILTYDVRVDKDQRNQTDSFIRGSASETILSKIRVMAVDQTAKSEDREAKVGKVLTVEVTSKGAEVLALALEMGELSFALRRLGDSEEESDVMVKDKMANQDIRIATTDVEMSSVLQKLNALKTSGTSGAAPLIGNAVQQNANTTVIHIYRGGESERHSVPLAPEY